MTALLVGGPMAVAALVGGLVLARPEWLAPVLAADLWLLGYHHVIATYTRVGLDPVQRERHAARALRVALPCVVGAWILASLGVWLLVGVYLYWQWWHYARQSYGIWRLVSRREREPVGGPGAASGRVSLWAVVAWGVALRSSAESFLGLPVHMLVVPSWVADAIGLIFVGSLCVWVVRGLLPSLRAGRGAHGVLYLASHHAVFLAAHVVIDDFTTGWLVANAWHSAQYLLVVWSEHRRRFAHGIDPDSPLLSALVQPGVARALGYVACCLVATVVLYGGLQQVGGLLGASVGASAILVAGQALNFHHYVVDSFIWKAPPAASPALAAGAITR